MYKAICGLKEGNKGLTLVELLVVVAIIGMLAAIAIPGYIGMQERGRKTAVIFDAKNARLDLFSLASAASDSSRDLYYIDTNGDSSIDHNDLTNGELAELGVVDAFINKAELMGKKSPWNDEIPLWENGGYAQSLEECEVVALNNPGRIHLCYAPEEGQAQVLFTAAAVLAHGHYTDNYLVPKASTIIPLQ